jgi:hypothetical protein
MAQDFPSFGMSPEDPIDLTLYNAMKIPRRRAFSRWIDLGAPQRKDTQVGAIDACVRAGWKETVSYVSVALHLCAEAESP